MDWFSQNWVWLLLFAGFVAMHMFGHGGHGGHGGAGDASHDDPKPKSRDGAQQTSEQKPRHQH